MKCKKLTIETDGTTANTLVSVDGKAIGMIARLKFSADSRDRFINLNIEKVRLKDGKFVLKKKKIRNEKTQKFEEIEVAETESLIIEFIK